jgi:hypothetical protein
MVAFRDGDVIRVVVNQGTESRVEPMEKQSFCGWRYSKQSYLLGTAVHHSNVLYYFFATKKSGTLFLG